MVNGIIGRKVGMTQVFAGDGTVVPATVIKAGPCVVVQAKTAQTDGYEAIQLGLVDDTTPKGNKPTSGHFKKAGVPPTRVRREVTLKAGGDALKAGDQVLVNIFAAGDRVDVIGTSRGRGFQGVMKRHNFAGGMASHGASLTHRTPGSIGQRQTPGRVFQGKRMSGHMGVRRRTVENLKVVEVDAERNLLLIRGAVPGPSGGIVFVRNAVKSGVKA
jgi:large subunit ribosomal protein L3